MAQEKKKFFKTTYKIIVLTENKPFADENPALSDIHWAMITNECVADFQEALVEEVSEEEMQHLLCSVGSDPLFFKPLTKYTEEVKNKSN